MGRHILCASWGLKDDEYEAAAVILLPQGRTGVEKKTSWGSRTEREKAVGTP